MMQIDRCGYTVVELMMALAVLAVSVSGVIAMQKVTVVSNSNARDVAVANRIAQSWIEQLRVEAQVWNATSDLTTSDSGWLGLTPTEAATDPPDFVLPDPARAFGPAFNAVGQNVDRVNPADVKFCTHLRLRRLTPATAQRGLIRVTVRVFWRRRGGSQAGDTIPADLCSETAANVSNPDNARLYHSVYHTTVVRQHTTP